MLNQIIRITVGGLSFLLSWIILEEWISWWYYQQYKTPKGMDLFMMTSLSSALSSWIIWAILGLAGFLLILKFDFAKVLYHFFCVAALSECLFLCYEFSSLLGWLDLWTPYLLLLSIVFFIVIYSKRFNNYFAWKTHISKRIWMVNFVISWVVVIVPRPLLYGFEFG